MSEKERAMTEHTPTTDEIVRYYLDGSRDWFPGLTTSERNERFDRWLAEVRRETAEKAWDEGRKAEALSWKHVFDGHPVAEGEMCGECKVVNPYRKGQS